MRKARGPDRRDYDNPKSWGIKLPKGFVDRRRHVERRKPEVTEVSFEEFETLMKHSKEEKKPDTAETPSIGLDQLLGRL